MGPFMDKLPGLPGTPKLPDGEGEPVDRGEGDGELHGTEPGRTGRLRLMGDVRLGDVDVFENERPSPNSTERENEIHDKSHNAP
jgi:hypothetical protein